MKPRLSQRFQFSLAYLLVAIVVLSLLQSWLLAPRTVELPMSKFLELLRADKVERVAITDREIRGVAKPDALPTPPDGALDRLRELLGSSPEVRVFTVTRIPGVEGAAHRRARGTPGRVHGQDRVDLSARPLLRLDPPARRHGRDLDVPDAPGGRRAHAGPVVRPLQAQDLRPQGAEDDVRRRGRRGRGEGRAGRDRGLPPDPEEVPAARWPHPEGGAPGRPAGNREDAPGARGG